MAGSWRKCQLILAKMEKHNSYGCRLKHAHSQAPACSNLFKRLAPGGSFFLTWETRNSKIITFFSSCHPVSRQLELEKNVRAISLPSRPVCATCGRIASSPTLHFSALADNKRVFPRVFWNKARDEFGPMRPFVSTSSDSSDINEFRCHATTMPNPGITVKSEYDRLHYHTDFIVCFLFGTTVARQ